MKINDKIKTREIKNTSLWPIGLPLRVHAQFRVHLLAQEVPVKKMVFLIREIIVTISFHEYFTLSNKCKIS